MKTIVSIAKRTVNDRDSFFNGFVKGVAGSAIMLIIVNAVAAFH